ncbi:MAG: PorT family protein [Flavobacterium sp.]|nr:MAG: PorT family protein [Flavobacterium sp.]
MKNLFFTVILALGLASVSYGQDKGNVEFGLNIGYNASSVQVSRSYFQPDSRQSLNFGFAADYYFSDRWSLKGKLIYDQKGWDNGSFEDASGNFYLTDYNLNYLTVPVMANWHFGSKRNWYLNFGPYVGFLMSAEETTGGVDVKEGFNSTDFGLALGIGVKIPVSDKLKISLEYEGQGGGSEIFKENNSYRVSNTRSSLNVGVNFMLK